MSQNLREATVGDVLALIEDLAPFSLSDAYIRRYGGRDNSGLLLGSRFRPVFRVLVCLDITGEVVTEAADLSAECIVSHHPLIYTALSSVSEDEPEGAVVAELIRSGIAVAAAHLNLDAAPFGINQILADIFELTGARPVLPVGEDAGMGRVGKTAMPRTLDDMVRRCNDVFGGVPLRVIGRGDCLIAKAAVLAGGCGGDMTMLKEAVCQGAELIITGDVPHHAALWLQERGIALIDAGHHATEAVALPEICETLRRYAEAEGLDIEVALSTVDTNPFR